MPGAYREPVARPSLRELIVVPGLTSRRVIVALVAAVAVAVLAPHAGMTAHAPNGPIPLGAMVGLVVLFSTNAWVRRRVTFDPERRVVILERDLVGLFARRTELDVARFTSAELIYDELVGKTKSASDSGRYFVALNEPNGERTPLLGWGTQQPAPTQALVAALNLVLDADAAPEAAMPTSAPIAVISCQLAGMTGFIVVAVVFFCVLSVAFMAYFAPGSPVGWALGLVTGVWCAVTVLRTPRRRVLVHGDEKTIVVELRANGLLSLHATRTPIAIAQIRGASLDRQGVEEAVVLVLENGSHVPLTGYSNAAFGAKKLARELNAAMGTQAPTGDAGLREST